MLNFTYDQLPTRVVFGVGAFDRLAAEVERLGATRALVLATPEQRDQAKAAAEIGRASCRERV